MCGGAIADARQRCQLKLGTGIHFKSQNSDFVRGGLIIVLLTRHYPPERAGGSRRPYALATGLRALGHRVIVVAPHGAQDVDLIEVPHPVFPVVEKNDHLDTRVRPTLLDWLRRWLLLPDPEIRWAFRAMRAIEAAKLTPHWIITTSPPESLHVIGALLKQRRDVKWLADVRDLWLTSPQRQERNNSLRAAAERVLARWCLSKADALVGVSPTVTNEAAALAGNTALPSMSIGHFAAPYGGDKHAFPLDTFNIVHTGAIGLSNPLSDITPLLSAFEALVSLRPDAHLWLAGRLNQTELTQIRRSPHRDKITFLGLVSQQEARALQAGSDALALVSGPTSHALPGKFSEYQTTGLPILLAGDGPWRALVPKGAALDFAEGVTLPKSAFDALDVKMAGDHIEAAQAFLDLMTPS